MLKILLGIVIFLNAIIALLLFHIADKSYFSITIFMAISSSIASIYFTKNNFVYQLRVIVICWVSVIPALAIFQGAYFSRRMPYLQIDEVGWLFSILACLSLFSSQIGFYFADQRKFEKKNIDFVNGNKIVFWTIFFLIVIVGYLISLSRGDYIFDIAYRQGELIKMPVQNLQAVAGILLSWLFIMLNRINKNNIVINSYNILTNGYLIIFIFTSFYLIFWAQLFRGARMDPANLLIVLFVLYYSLKSKIASLNFKYFLIFILSIIFLKFWGVARTQISSGIPLSHLLNLNLFAFRTLEINGIEVKYFFDGTFPNLSTGVAAVFIAIREGLTEFWYGKSYLDFILRIPPEIIYPDRPQSLASLINYWFGDNHGGGFNEMGETYLNFGIYGSLIIPGIISYIIGSSYKSHLFNPNNLKSSLIFTAIIAVYIRFLLYQTFGGFKSFITALILYFFIYLMYQSFNFLSKSRRIGK